MYLSMSVCYNIVILFISCTLPSSCTFTEVIELGFEESEYRINERAANNQYVALKVCLKQGDEELLNSFSEPVTVTISTRGGTAKSKCPIATHNKVCSFIKAEWRFAYNSVGTDFMDVSSNRTFSLPLQRFEVCECLSVIQDDIVEGDEVFYLTLISTHPQVRTTGAVVHIVDDDGKILMSILVTQLTNNCSLYIKLLLPIWKEKNILLWKITGVWRCVCSW